MIINKRLFLGGGGQLQQMMDKSKIHFQRYFGNNVQLGNKFLFILREPFLLCLMCIYLSASMTILAPPPPPGQY